MHSPFDYQIDYLSGINLIYTAFPQPIKITYFKIKNRTELHSATEVSKSNYAHILDDTSIAKFSSIEELPVYFVEGNQPKAMGATDMGAIFNQSELTCVIPSVYGFEPTVNEFISFDQTGPTRLYKIQNIEISNIIESGVLRGFKLTLKIDTKNKNDIQPKIETEYSFFRKFGVVLLKTESKYIDLTLLPLINIYLKQIDQNIEHDYNYDILSKMYNEFKSYFSVVLEYNDFKKLNILRNYEGMFHSYFLESPAVFEGSLIPDIAKIAQDISEVNYAMNSDNLGTISIDNKFKEIITDVMENSVFIKDYKANSVLEKLMIINLLFKSIDKIVKGA